jgi:CRP/FNR family transcriptional regulator, cyclic AMP receptor protein
VSTPSNLLRISAVPAPTELVERVPLFSDLSRQELQGLASSMKERQFNEGDTIATEGQSGIGFFVIEEGEATVSIGGKERATLKAGDHFGEIALIDDGARTATVTAKTPLKAYGITAWEFRPMVEQNAGLAWKLLQELAKRLRDAELRTG